MCEIENGLAYELPIVVSAAVIELSASPASVQLTVAVGRPAAVSVNVPPAPRTVSCWISRFVPLPCCVVVTEAPDPPSAVVVIVACGPFVTDAGAIWSIEVEFRSMPKIAWIESWASGMIEPLVFTLARSPTLVPKSTAKPPSPTSSSVPPGLCTLKMVGAFELPTRLPVIELRSALETVALLIALNPFSAEVTSEPDDSAFVRSSVPPLFG